MESLDTHIKNLQNKLQLLLKHTELIVKQNAALQKEVDSLRISMQEKNDLIVRLNQQIDILKLSSNGLQHNEKKLLEKRINTYLADIEKCITILNA